MPLNKCAGGRGWKWGESGKCYTGKDAKKKAIKQGLAMGDGHLEKADVGDSLQIEIPVEITKTQEDKQFVFGWANVAKDAEGNVVVDSHGDTISVDELEQAAYQFNLHYRATGEMHVGDVKGELIESFMVTPEKLEKMGLPAGSLPLGLWVGFHVSDKELFEKVKSGKYRSFSIQGTARRKKDK